MISIYSIKNAKLKPAGQFISVELRGLSTDEKPTEIDERLVDNGSTFIEIDTGKIYMYDLEHEEWKEI